MFRHHRQPLVRPGGTVGRLRASSTCIAGRVADRRHHLGLDVHCFIRRSLDAHALRVLLRLVGRRVRRACVIFGYLVAACCRLVWRLRLPVIVLLNRSIGGCCIFLVSLAPSDGSVFSFDSSFEPGFGSDSDDSGGELRRPAEGSLPRSPYRQSPRRHRRQTAEPYPESPSRPNPHSLPRWSCSPLRTESPHRTTSSVHN